MNTYLRNTITGLYFDGTAFSVHWLDAKPVDADAAVFAHQFWENVEIVEEQPTALTLDGETFTTAGRWLRLNS